ncbi:hypothetical protein [Rhodopirellula europaea]|jgi:hypothetical protein|uniref:Putative membrane protein n=1 Tax=Rhodopirellula europaea SH398 TaxID=1263868 RepID=M5SBW4_9BACT|nr:hypothetical protein [Rhodopirellula europaea]EMI28980.1 putative membrane protein [Rhodopirellula europaea SH398]MCR9211926.1 hypothetical protein [bacterium]
MDGLEIFGHVQNADPSHFQWHRFVSGKFAALRILTRNPLVGIAVTSIASFTLVMAMWPPQPTQHRVSYPRALRHVVSAGKPNATEWSHRIVANDNVDGFRKRLLNAQHPKASANVGWVRWRSEVAAFYAKAEQDRVASNENASESPLRLASHTTSDPSSNEFENTSKWAAFWQSETARTNEWLAGYERANADRIAMFAKSIEVNTLPMSWPARAWAWAIGVALMVAVTAWTWLEACPVRRLELASLGIGDQRAEPADGSESDWTEMAFRAEWVAVSQPVGVWLRRTAAVSLVVAASVLVLIRAIGIA